MGRAILCVVIVCAWLGSARAAGDDAAAGAAAEAKRHFEEGTKLYNLGEFRAAAVEYKAAYKAKPDSVFLYNVAQALRLNNEPASALFFYRSYLRTTPNAANRKEVDRRIKELDALLVAQPKPAPAPSPTPPKVEAPTSPSKAQASPTSPSKAQASPTPSLAAPDPEPATVAPARAEPAVAPVTATKTAPERTPVYKKWWLWTAVGVTVLAGVAIAVGVGLSAGTHAPQSDRGTVFVF